MAINITSFTGYGLKDWVWQRVSAIYLAFYMGFVLFYCISNLPLEYDVIHNLFQCYLMKTATVLALVMILAHAFIGIWTVATDYIKCNIIRLVLQVCVFIYLFSQIIVGSVIVWGL
jgi:succinate dehydrogenase / fumarate reductase, membrane anchor subunit